MNIIWTSCKKQMPPNNQDMIIAKMDGERYQVGTGILLHQLFGYIQGYQEQVDPSWKWTNYTDELWEELNK